MKNFKKILFLAFLLFPLILFFSACATPPQQKKQKAQNVITKKIIANEQKPKIKIPKQTKAKTDTPKKADTDTPKKAKTDTPKKADTDTPKKAKTDTPKKADTDTPKKADTDTPKKADTDTPKKADADSKLTLQNDNLKDEIKNDKTIVRYTSKGKLDPFISPISKANTKERKQVINRKLTPLEKLDFSQIKLVAVIAMQSGNKNIAMVQESSGKGYMVKIGTYIGQNNGRIIEIKNDKIIIKERVKNFKGSYEDSLKTMKLQKKDNG